MIDRIRPKIDIHSHPLPQKFAAGAAKVFDNLKAIACFTGMDPRFHCDNPSYETLAGLMMDSNVVFSTSLPVATTALPEELHRVNETVLEQCRQYPQFIPFGMLNPDVSGFEKEVRYLAANGFKGVKIHSYFQGFDPLNPKPMRQDFYQAIANSGLLLLPDMGRYLEIRQNFALTPEKLLEILAMAPGLRVIAPHMGGVLCWDQTHLLKDTSVLFDTSYSFYVDRAFHGGKYRDQLLQLIADLGPERFMFGTDFPYVDIAEEVALFDELGLSLEAAGLIGCRNAMQLLGLRKFDKIKIITSVDSLAGLSSKFLSEISNKLGCFMDIDLYFEDLPEGGLKFKRDIIMSMASKFNSAKACFYSALAQQDQLLLEDMVVDISLYIQLILRTWENMREGLEAINKDKTLEIDKGYNKIKELLS